MTKGEKIQSTFIIVTSLVLIFAAYEPLAVIAAGVLGLWGGKLLFSTK